MECLERAQVPHFMVERLEEETEAGDPSVLMGLLLSALPALETLVTDFTMMQGAHLLGTIFEHSDKLKLRRVAIRNNLDSRIIRASESWIQSVLCVSSLEELSTVLPRVSEDEIAGANLPALRSLMLVDHLSEPEAISTLLSKAPKLERLTYFLVEDTDDLAADEDYEQSHSNEWAKFAEALTHVARSLKTLKISIDEAATADYPPDTMDERWMMGISQRRGRIPSLQHLIHLTKLEIPTCLLVGFSLQHCIPLSATLPPSLQELYLRDDHVYDHGLVGATSEELLSMIDSYFLDRSSKGAAPLQELRIKLRGRGVTEWLAAAKLGSTEYLRMLESLGKRSGVKMTVHQRKDTYISTEQDVIDVVDELVVYDPQAAANKGDIAGAGDMARHTTGYPSRRRLKRARVFYSNT